MTSSKVNKQIWVKIFKECGLSEKMMNNWHTVFENQCPEGHEEFLVWIGIKPNEVKQIKNRSK